MNPLKTPLKANLTIMNNQTIISAINNTSVKLNGVFNTKKNLAGEKRKKYLQEYQKSYRKEYKTLKKRVSITFDIDEYNALALYSKENDTKLNQQIKSIILSHIHNKPIIPKESQNTLNSFVFLIRNIANNINQLTKQSNIFKTVINSKQVFNELSNLEQIVKDFVLKSI